MKTIVLIGTLDTKGEEYAFLKDLVERRGFAALVVDAGVSGSPPFAPDVRAAETAEAGGAGLELLRSGGDRGEAVAVMGRGAAVIMRRLAGQGRVQGVIALGGGGGTSIACAGMRALPPGIPKVMVSTLAGRDVSGYVGASDIVMFPSLVDVAGLNRVLRSVIRRAAAAVCAMAEIMDDAPWESGPLVAVTMFGNTTPAVGHARPVLERSGMEVVVFPCSGASGTMMERLIDSGEAAGVLDITTTELADQLAGGVLAAGEERLEAAGRRGVPQVVAPGCLDMVNFWAPDTVPERYRGRLLHRHNPHVTLMRTDVEESRRLGEIIAGKLNRARGPCAVFLPLDGLSMIDAPGRPFWWPEADRALFAALTSNLDPGIPVVEMRCNINDPPFGRACAEKLVELMGRTEKGGEGRRRGGSAGAGA
jgi:uncharacterized protein (UPF0261 family)